MKKKLFFLPALAAFFFASCSSDEPAAVNPDINPDGVNYMAVRISNIGQGSKAVSTDESKYENASGNEGTLAKENLYFLFFDANGNAFPLAYANVNGTVTTNMVRPSNISYDETTGADKTLTGVLVLGKAVGEGYVGTMPTKVVCVANPKTEVMKTLENKPLSQVLGQVTTPVPDSWYGDAASFLMTNSTYVDNSTVVKDIDVTGCIKGSPEEAQAAPVKIYIERVVAKVRANYAESYTVQRRTGDNTTEVNGTFMVDNEESHFTAVIDGWQLFNTASQANAFKNLNADYQYEWNWNDLDNHRSYWAESAAGANLNNNTYDLYDAAQFANKSFVTTSPLANIQYCFENTSNPTLALNDRTQNKATGIVVKATIMRDGQPIDMLRWAGTYYTSDRLKKRVADAYMASHPGVTVTEANVSFVSDGGGTNTFHAVCSGQDMTEMFNNLLWWRNGVTSYYTNIEHFGGLTGVVRNHIYDYVIDGIVGLGVPGNNPDVPTETEQFLSCHVRVLNWHVVSNNVTLE